MNILIVDDQPSVLASLTTTINWKSVGIDQVYSASSTLAAKNIIDKESIQILLTDIEMPVENGLELVRWLRKKELAVECILLTSHTDFSYAKKGIELGVVDYVVQPASNAAILAAVEKVISKITFQNIALKNQLAGKFSNYEINYLVKHFFKSWPDPELSEDFEDQLNSKINRLNELGYICGKESGCLLFLTVIDEWSALPLSETECRHQYSENIRSVFSSLNGQTSTYSEDGSHFVTLLLLSSYDNVEHYFQALQQQVKDKLKCSISIYYCPTDLRNLRAAFRFVTAVDPNDFERAGTGITKLYPTAKHRNLDLVSQNYRDYYKQIEEYIRSNITAPITRLDMSEHIHISPDYISHIVRSIAECSCKELIAREKMKYARNLIETTSMPIGEIAVECGFDSFAYFSKVYKTIYGVSPKNARNQTRRG